MTTLGTRARRRGARGEGAIAPRSVALVLTLLTAWCAAAAAQVDAEDGARRHGIFVDSVEVSLINVEVLATRDGEAVLDLTADDFELFDDGRPVEITNFTRSEPVGAPAADIEAADDQASDTVEAATAAAPAAGEPVTVIVMVDQIFLSPSSRARVFAALQAELAPLLDSGARILVASKLRQEVTVEQYFTADPAQIQAALDRLAGVAPPSYDAEIRTTAELWGMVPDAVDSRQVGPGQSEPALQTSELDARSDYQEARSLTERMYADVVGSLDAMHHFLDSLAGLPGRKALVYVADELPIRPAELLWRIWWDKYGREHGAKFGIASTGPAEFDASLPLEEMISDANASRVSFYPVGGSTGPNLADAASRGAPTRSGSIGRLTASAAADGLHWLSERTGGRGSGDAGTLDGFFTRLAGDLGAYYSLGFASPHQGDGGIHRLEVKVKRPDVTLRYPTQYRDKSADQRMTDRTLSILTLGIEDNALDVRVSVGKLRKEKGKVTVPLEIHVPLANLVLLPDKTAHRGKLSIQLIAVDGRGRLSDPVLVRMPLEVAHRDMSWALTQTVDYATEMTLADGTRTIAVGVHDDFGFTFSTVGVDLGGGGAE